MFLYEPYTILHFFFFFGQFQGLLETFYGCATAHAFTYLVYIGKCVHEYCPNLRFWHTPFIPAPLHAKDSNNNGISHSEFYLQKNKSITMNMAILDCSVNYMSVQFLLLILFLSRSLSLCLCLCSISLCLSFPIVHLKYKQGLCICLFLVVVTFSEF